MNGLEFTCDTCGTRFEAPNLIGGTGSAFMSGNRVGCPVQGCSGWGHHEAGTYDFVDGVVKAFTAPGMTRQKVEAFREVAQQVKAHKLTSQEAKAATAEYAASLAKVWDWVGENDKQVQVLLLIIGLLLAHYHFVQMSSGAQADLEVRQQTVQAAQTNAKALERIGAELERMNVVPQAAGSPDSHATDASVTPSANDRTEKAGRQAKGRRDGAEADEEANTPIRSD